MAADARRFGLPASIRVRATVGAMVVAAAALTIGAFLQIRAVEDHLVESTETSAESLVIDVAERARVGDLPSTVVVADDETQFVQVVDARGEVIAASDNVETDAAVVALDTELDDDEPEDRSGTVEYDPETETFSDLPIDEGDEWIVSAVPVTTDAGVVTVYAGVSLDEVTSTLGTLRASLLVGLPVLVLLVGLVTRTVIRRALRPVAAMRADLDEITTRRLDRRIVEPASDDEIADLARSMNEMLDRLEASVARERHFIGDASHELRSPLAALRAQLEVAVAHPDASSWKATLRSALRSTERIEGLVADLLVLAQVDAAPKTLPTGTVDLGQLVADEVEQRPELQGSRLRTMLEPDVVVHGHAGQLSRLLHNLIDNAVRHAASQVSIEVRRADGSAVLEVADDGPGIPVGDHSRVFERFTRLDDARDRDAGGTGLGLAIVNEVAIAHGGTVRVSEPPGASFVVRLPLASTDPTALGLLRDP